MAKEKYTTFTPRKLQTNFTMGLSQNYIKVQMSLFTHIIYYMYRKTTALRDLTSRLLTTQKIVASQTTCSITECQR